MPHLRQTACGNDGDKTHMVDQTEHGFVLTTSAFCAAAPASKRRQKQRTSKKGSTSAPVSPCNAADPAPVLTELHNSVCSRAATAAAATSASRVVTECIVLDSDTNSDAAGAHRSAPVSPLQSASARDAGGGRRAERSIDELTLLRSLFADPSRPRTPWPFSAREPAAATPPVQQVQTHLSFGDAYVSHTLCSTAVLSPSPLPLRERLRHRVEQHPCEATHSIPGINLAGHSNTCQQYFGEPGIAGVGGNIWRTQDSQPSGQANAGLQTHFVLGSEQLHEASDCISLLTP